jgi:hypothetical protein
MHAVLIVLVVVTIVAYVIGRQLRGEALRGKRLIVLPIVLAAIGAIDLHGDHLRPADVGFIGVSALVAAGIGLAQGRMMRLESRGGYLWGQMPLRSLWLWLALVGSRVLLMVLASGAHAHVAASTSSILLVLGVNRLCQALVVAPRAWSAGIPFAPEKDGNSFLAGAFTDRVVTRTSPTVSEAAPDAPATTDTGRLTPMSAPADGVDWKALAQQAGAFLADRHARRHGR